MQRILDRHSGLTVVTVLLLILRRMLVNRSGLTVVAVMLLVALAMVMYQRVPKAIRAVLCQRAPKAVRRVMYPRLPKAMREELRLIGLKAVLLQCRSAPKGKLLRAGSRWTK